MCNFKKVRKMILGKKFSRLKRSLNAGSIDVTFTRREDGTVLKPHRKLNMLLVLSLSGKANRKATRIEVEKLFRRYGNKKK